MARVTHEEQSALLGAVAPMSHPIDGLVEATLRLYQAEQKVRHMTRHHGVALADGNTAVLMTLHPTLSGATATWCGVMNMVLCCVAGGIAMMTCLQQSQAQPTATNDDPPPWDHHHAAPAPTACHLPWYFWVLAVAALVLPALFVFATMSRADVRLRFAPLRRIVRLTAAFLLLPFGFLWLLIARVGRCIRYEGGNVDTVVAICVVSSTCATHAQHGHCVC